MNYPKISIISPSYNQGKYLEETIGSILSQDYPNLEYIIIDGGSNDNSVEIIKRYSSFLTYWISEKDSGQSNAINKGFAKATGEIITWINSDDLLLPNTLHKVAELFSAAPDDLGVIHGGVVLFDEKRNLKKVYTYGKPSQERYLSGMGFSQPGAFIRKRYLDQVGYLQEGLHYGMDYDLFARLASVSRFMPVNELFAKYRLHNESKSVAHHDKFRSDWNRVFLSLCFHLGWNHIIGQAISFVPELKTEQPRLIYKFYTQQEYINTLDSKRVLYYFLTDLLLHYYWYDHRNEARILLEQLKRDFPPSWLIEDERVNSVISKLMLPEFVLKPLKKLRQTFRSGLPTL